MLDSGDLEIKVRVKGYSFPSAFHDSSVCVALSSGDSFLEECFVEAPDLRFHVNGLGADSSYSLRVIFYERNEAIAVSVRNFRVGGIKVTNSEDEVVTIQTAVQLALSYELSGDHDGAKRIYHSILSIDPSHAYTLHLLGLHAFQSGDAEMALPLLHKALLAIEQSTADQELLPADMDGYDGFYHSLGECYRVLGRYAEAEDQFLHALELNPHHVAAKHSLGILYQVTNDWKHAIQLYQDVVASFVSRNNSAGGGSETNMVGAENALVMVDSLGGSTHTNVDALDDSGAADPNMDNDSDMGASRNDLIITEEDSEVFLSAKIRECDLLQTLYFSAHDGTGPVRNIPEELMYYFNTTSENYNQIIANCWLHGIELFPDNHLMYNELANLLLRVGQYADAIPLYRTAVSLGNTIAQVNLAHVLESMGYADESRSAFQALVTYATNADNLPYTHFLLRQITVSPRVLPASDADVKAMRLKMNADLDMFLQMDSKSDNFHVDNSPPLHFGFYTGFYWAYQVGAGTNGTGNNHGSGSTGAATGDRDHSRNRSVETNNILLKTKLYHAYLKYCPALAQGVFVDALEKKYKAASSNSTVFVSKEDFHSDSAGTGTGTTDTSVNDGSDAQKQQNPHYFRLLYTENDEVFLRMHAEGGVRILDIAPTGAGVGVETPSTVMATTSSLNKMPYSSPIEFARRKYAKRIRPQSHARQLAKGSSTQNLGVSSNSKKLNPVKIGFISRFLRVHAVGLLVEGLVQRLSEYEEYEIHIFLVGETDEDFANSDDGNSTGARDAPKVAPRSKYHDPVQVNIISHADFTYYLSTDISEISQFVRSLALDILIYPEVGIDPVCYFLSFTRLAPVQAAWIGHPDTSGVATIDYYITSDLMPELLAEADKRHLIDQAVVNAASQLQPPTTKQELHERYKHLDKKQAKLLYEQQQQQKAAKVLGKEPHDSTTISSTAKPAPFYRSLAPGPATALSSSYSEENVFMLRNLGTFFIDSNADYVRLLHQSPRTALMDRSKFIDYLHLPKTAHILLLAQPIYKLHSEFDEAIAKILTQDRLAYLVVIDSVNVTSWQQMYVTRLASKYTFDVKERVLFFVSTTMEDTLTAMAAAHVLLDPFPVSGYLPSMQALSIGLPVVTFPSDVLAGRMGLILYNMLGYHELVCHSAQEYVNKVHSITHNPKIREGHADAIIAARSKLFDKSTVADEAVHDWRNMIAHMMEYTRAVGRKEQE